MLHIPAVLLARLPYCKSNWKDHGATMKPAEVVRIGWSYEAESHMLLMPILWSDIVDADWLHKRKSDLSLLPSALSLFEWVSCVGQELLFFFSSKAHVEKGFVSLLSIMISLALYTHYILGAGSTRNALGGTYIGSMYIISASS